MGGGGCRLEGVEKTRPIRTRIRHSAVTSIARFCRWRGGGVVPIRGQQVTVMLRGLGGANIIEIWGADEA